MGEDWPLTWHFHFMAYGRTVQAIVKSNTTVILSLFCGFWSIFSQTRQTRFRNLCLAIVLLNFLQVKVINTCMHPFWLSSLCSLSTNLSLQQKNQLFCYFSKIWFISKYYFIWKKIQQKIKTHRYTANIRPWLLSLCKKKTYHAPYATPKRGLTY